MLLKLIASRDEAKRCEILCRNEQTKEQRLCTCQYRQNDSNILYAAVKSVKKKWVNKLYLFSNNLFAHKVTTFMNKMWVLFTKEKDNFAQIEKQRQH